MKNKFILVALVGFLIGFSGTVFAAPAKKTSLSTRTNALEKEVRVLKSKLYTMQNKEAYFGSNLDLFVEMYAHGPAVVTSPALGVRRNAEDASDLMVNLSSMHEDLVLLKLRQKMDRYAKANNIPIPQRPIIALSGGVEGRGNYLRDYDSSKSNNVDLSRAELDIVGEAGPWATAAMIISYDKEYPDRVLGHGGTRVSNSRLFIDRAFVTIGQLEKCPLYFTIGQIFAPFGRYSSYMLTNTSAKILGRVKDRMIVLGLSQAFTRDDASGSLSIQAYGYPGEMKVKDNSLVEHGGFNVDFEYTRGLFSMKVGGSMIGNIAESDGMQVKVFGNPKYKRHEKMQDRIFGFNGRAKVSFGMFNLLAEYVAAGKRFHPDDLYFYTEGAPKKGAQPKALTAEGAIEFKILGKPNTLAVGYGQTWEALGLGLPRNTFFASYALSFWRNTIFTVEYRRDVNYRFGKIGGGGDIDEVKVPDGRNRNTITAQFGVYF